MATNSSKDPIARWYFENASAERVSTDTALVTRLEHLYPNKHITVVPEASCNFFAYASSGNITITPDNDNITHSGPLEWEIYVPPASRLDGGSGQLGKKVIFGKYNLAWGDYKFILYIVEGRDGTQSYPAIRNNYIVSETANSTSSLILAAGIYGVALHGEIWVFDQGYWQKDAQLWQSIQKSRWEDVILDAEMKKAIIGDVTRFFDGRATYERLKVPWKRGVIYHGPPGNGKTISIKATMHMLYDRKDPIPTLYVKTLASFAGPESSLNSIFSKARATAPCYLVFEDLDSLVDDRVRSFFLNQVDGLNRNDGILMVGSTNHLDRLDPGISKRPSRFDRKYLFPNPNLAERVLYAEFWRTKLRRGEGSGEDGGKDPVEFPEELCKAIAGITKGFSFAYMQEAFVAALLAIAVDEGGRDGEELLQDFEFVTVGETSPEDGDGGDEEDLDKYVLWREIKRQIKILREDIDDSDDTAQSE
ncbi:hypothetical protein Vi05172_g13065 [Venturia inaequalis]|nr:hypothetical protein Vi05172_g13065 [Venturia inaequalis]